MVEHAFTFVCITTLDREVLRSAQHGTRYVLAACYPAKLALRGLMRFTTRALSFAPALRKESTHQKTFSSRATRLIRLMRAVRSSSVIRNAVEIMSAISSTS